jgi:hypothetical protein
LGKGEGGFDSMRIIDQAGGYYESQEVEFGKVYKWEPERFVVECECGKRSTYTRLDLISLILTCECSKENTACIREELVVQVLGENEALHPWRYLHYSTFTKIPF